MLPQLGVSLRQLALIKHQRYAHAHQIKRANRSLRKLKTYLGRVIRDYPARAPLADAGEGFK
jgi:IS5 family transposase